MRPGRRGTRLRGDLRRSPSRYARRSRRSLGDRVIAAISAARSRRSPSRLARISASLSRSSFALFGLRGGIATRGQAPANRSSSAPRGGGGGGGGGRGRGLETGEGGEEVSAGTAGVGCSVTGTGEEIMLRQVMRCGRCDAREPHTVTRRRGTVRDCCCCFASLRVGVLISSCGAKEPARSHKTATRRRGAVLVSCLLSLRGASQPTHTTTVCV